MVVVFGTKTNPAVEYTLFFREPIYYTPYFRLIKKIMATIAKNALAGQKKQDFPIFADLKLPGKIKRCPVGMAAP
ncbi:MAG: hypothetical protein KAT00_01810 [Planctomycetes bacterium]|nr:hypothetical protein [Planctomycetota bacterium]